MSNEVRLGALVRDRITGVQGIVVGITDWLYGCRTVTVSRTDLSEKGEVRERLHFDEPQLETIKEIHR